MITKAHFERFYIEDSTTGCWVWTGAHRGQHGRIRVGRSVEQAHRVAWLLYCGEIPAGLQVHHRCNYGLCVNPAHMFVGTQADRKSQRYGWRRTDGAHRKLTPDEVLAIRHHLRRGRPHQVIADLYMVTRGTIGAIARGVTHKVDASQSKTRKKGQP